LIDPGATIAPGDKENIDQLPTDAVTRGTPHLFLREQRAASDRSILVSTDEAEAMVAPGRRR